VNETDFEFVEFGEIGWYDLMRGKTEKPSIKWIWSGPNKKFGRSKDKFGFAGGKPYTFQHIIQDPQPVYIRKGVTDD
jgi:hypothetical protein